MFKTLVSVICGENTRPVKPGYVGLANKTYFGWKTVSDFETKTIDSFLEEQTKEAKTNTLPHFGFVRITKVWCMESPVEVSDMTDEQWSQFIGYRTEFGKHIQTIEVRPPLDPETEVYICHKCGGKLMGTTDKLNWCRCISGWIRDTQRPVKIAGLKINSEKMVER